MKSIVVLISGSGSNLQAIIDACSSGFIPAKVTAVIANKADAYGLVRASDAGIATEALSHKAFSNREDYDQALIKTIDAYQPRSGGTCWLYAHPDPLFCKTLSRPFIKRASVLTA